MIINRNNYEIYFLDHLEGRLPASLQEEFRLFLDANADLKQELDEMGEAMGITNLPKGIVDGDFFDSKQLLKKNEESASGLSHLDELFAKQVEGTLTPVENDELSRILQNDHSARVAHSYFNRTKLNAPIITFDEADSLKVPEIFELSGHKDFPLIAAVEGDLTPQEQAAFDKELNHSETLRHSFNIYKKTKLTAESILFDAKDSLRKKETKVLPLRRAFYYVSSAAAVVALVFWMNGVDTTVNSELANASSRYPSVNKATDTPKDTNSTHQQDFEKRAPYPTAPMNEIILSDQDMADKQAPSNSQPQNRDEKKVNPPSESLAANPLEPDPNQAQPIEPESVVTPMQEVFAHTAPKNADTREPKTVLNFLTEKAEQKLESTQAYSFVERNAHRLSSTAKGLSDQVKVERIAKNEKQDELKVKLGPVEWKRSVDKKSGSDDTKKGSNLINRTLNKIR